MRLETTVRTIAAVLLACASSHLPAAGSPSPPELDPIAAVSRAPAIDGALTDPAWSRATTYRDFVVKHPTAGATPSEQTQLYLAHDRAHLYVGIRSLDRSPKRIRAEASDPADAWNDDWVSFCLDSRDEGLGAYFFLVTPGGVRVSGTLDINGSPRPTTTLQWTSAVKRTAQGYTAEFAIPLAQLPYDPANPIRMSFRAIRHISRTAEEIDFPRDGPPVADVTPFRGVLLSGIESSRERDDDFAADLARAYAEKIRLSAVFDTNTLDGRVHAYGDASVSDYRIFPSRPLTASRSPLVLGRQLDETGVRGRFAPLEYMQGRPIGNLERFLAKTQTTAFIVIKDDQIVYEEYFNGADRQSIATSFSMAKSFDSTLVGIAIDKGLIHGVDDPITNYLPELAQRDTRFARITIGDLMHMSSGLAYEEGAPMHDNQRTYMDPDLRQAALAHSRIAATPNTRWLYNNYNPLLIGMILERATRMSVTAFMQATLWEPLGMAFDASWSLDSDADAFEKMESGINARPLDYARFGLMFLHHGKSGQTQVVSEAWVRQATQPRADPAGFYGNADGRFYYGYFWWGSRREDGDSDFYADGNKGQFIYVSPQKRLVIVRTGIQYGVPAWVWSDLFRRVADAY